MTQLGIVTYNIAKDWDLPTILSRLEKLGYARTIVTPRVTPNGSLATDRVLIGRWLARILCPSAQASVAVPDRSEAGLAIRRRGRTQGFGVATWRR
jgi:hypothetical protein